MGYKAIAIQWKKKLNKPNPKLAADITASFKWKPPFSGQVECNTEAARASI